jgi:hypothetical protein
MNKATSTLMGAIIAVALSGGAFAQGNNTLATPTTKSPVDATSGYGTPGTIQSESGAATMNTRQQSGMDANSASDMPAYGVNNTLARPTTKSPAGQ